MPENEKKKLNERDLGNIILCEPITSRGIKALQELELQNDVTVEDFFRDLYIPPKYYEKQSSVITEDQSSDNASEEYLQHIYTEPDEIFNEKKDRLKLFDDKFVDNVRDHSPLNIIGTSGVGKSIEAYAKIRNPKRNNVIIASNRIIYSLEKSYKELVHGLTFRLTKAQRDNASWLICIIMLEELYTLIEKNSENVSTIASNFLKYFKEKNITEVKEENIFDSIKNYSPADSDTGKKLFENMTMLVEENDASQSIENILKITMNIMYCINPENKNYIVFDNLENHIELNEQYIIIHSSALSDLYKSAVNVMNNLTIIYNRINEDESWKAFKIIIVMRRTTGRLIEKTTKHESTKYLGNRNDYTGHFDIWRIWEKKEKFIWEQYLKEKYELNQSLVIIWILNNMMKDNPSAVRGTSYQELISPLMNSGIRRNGRAQAHAAVEVYSILFSNNNCYINYEIYNYLLGKKTERSEIRYMYRRALLEIQYKWMIYPDEARLRFENLLLGKLAKKKETEIKDKNGKKIVARNVIWDNNINRSNITLVRRILSYLSNFKDNKTYTEDDTGNNYGTMLYATKTLYELMEGIFLNPSDSQEKILNYNEHFFPLAKVLTSLGSMSHEATKAAPFLILDIDDSRINSSDSENQIADILREIWQNETAENNSFKDSDKDTKYGVRLTEAGHVFLCDIQPSFSFFAALYCVDEKPLFFLTDPNRIKLVINTIYESADKLCNIYEQAAFSFCTRNNTLHIGNYLPKYDEEYVTFKRRVKELHSQHLNHYIDYIEKNADSLGLTSIKKELTDDIKGIISKYNNWKTGKESAECF